MVSALSVTLNMPNIGLIIYYIICIIIIPIILINTENQNMLQLYLPLLLPIASVLQESGGTNMYNNILIKDDINSVSIISTFITCLLTLIGIFWFSITVSMNNENLANGILVGLLLIVLVFGFSRILIPELIKKGDKLLGQHTDLSELDKIHRYIIGFILVIFICLVTLSIQKLYHVDEKVIIRRKINF